MAESMTAAMDEDPEQTASQARKVAAFIVMVFGMFMAILDIQIVSSSLSEIQAGLSASADEISWVQTSYLIAEVIMIPLSGTLARIFSTRYLFALSAAGFTLMSLLCALSTSIDEMIIWRALQGFIGGAMIPTVFATSFSIFPPKDRAIISPVIGLIATLAPTIGPTVGGYLTDLFSWQWLFLVNIAPGIMVTIGAWMLINVDKPQWHLARHFDWAGLVSMALFLGSLEYVLEEGPGEDWLDSQVIANMMLLCAASCIYFFWHVTRAEHPVVSLSSFKNRNFSFGSLFSFTMGIGLYGLTYLYPVYLSSVQGYSALQIGETLFVTGLAMFLTAPVAGRLSAKIDPRLMIGAGFLGFALGTWQASFINSDWSFNELLVPQILRGVSLMLCMVTVTNISLGTVAPARLGAASGLFNLTRNLGGAFGLALIATGINNRRDFHFARLREQLTPDNPVAVEMLQGLEQKFSSQGLDGHLASLKVLTQLAQREAMTMAIADIFYLLTLLFVAIALLLPFISRPAQGMGGGH